MTFHKLVAGPACARTTRFQEEENVLVPVLRIPCALESPAWKIIGESVVYTSHEPPRYGFLRPTFVRCGAYRALETQPRAVGPFQDAGKNSASRV